MMTEAELASGGVPSHGPKRKAMLRIVGLVAQANVLSNKPLPLLDADDCNDVAALYESIAVAFRVYRDEIARDQTTTEKGN